MKIMQKIPLVLLTLGMSMLLLSPEVRATAVTFQDVDALISVIDGGGDGNTTVTLTNLNAEFGGYDFGFMVGNTFNRIVRGIGIRDYTFDTGSDGGSLEVLFAIRKRNTGEIFTEVASMIFLDPLAGFPGVYGTVVLDFAQATGFTISRVANELGDGVAPAPEPATVLLLSSIMAVGYGVLRKRMRKEKNM
jgi:hypothetical protein